MNKNLFLIALFISKTIFSQNGWGAYLNGPSGTFLCGPTTCLTIDKYGNKYLGFTNSNSTSPAAFAKYSKSGGFWSYYCQSNTPILPSNRVQCMAADTFGNVWIGTPLGLVKFDGGNFTVYTTTNGLPSNNILALHCVGSQVYISACGGLTRYDGATFYDYNKTNGLLCNDTIYSIRSETPNKLWLGHINGIIEFNINSSFTFSNYNYLPIPNSPNKVNCIFIDNTNKKWLGTLLKGVIEYDNVNFKLASVTYSDQIGVNLPTTCYNITKGPNNGPLFFTTCPGYAPPPSTVVSTSCLLELLPNGEAKRYYVPNSNYTIGDFMEADPSGEIFMNNKQLPHLGGFLKFMFSFKPSQYDPFQLGPGWGINNKNFKYLDVNRVKAGIANRGDKHWNPGGDGNARYEVPKGSGVHANFCSTFWIAGQDASNQLHVAAQMYRQTTGDFWPGPLDTTNATIDSATFNKYDKVWKVDYNDINTFITQFTLGNVPLTYTPTADILSWPAKGTGNNSRNLAPFVDVNNNGIYDPMVGGDYPQIKGDQTLYCIYNDTYDAHGETKGLPLGVEIHATAYAYGCPNFINGKNELAYTTFYHYKIINRSSNNYHDVTMGIFNDSDLGFWNDDRIACRVQDNLGFVYNTDGFDDSPGGALPGYGNYPPAAGTTVLKGPPAVLNDGIDNNNDGVIDEPSEECLMNKFLYFGLPFSPTNLARSAPSSSFQFHNYLNGRWRDSTDLTCGGNGYGGTLKTDFMYPWSYYPGLTCGLWGDNVEPNGDRRTFISVGPFNLNAQQSVEMEYAYVWAVDSSATGQNIGSAIKLINDAQKVRSFYYSNTPTSCLPNTAAIGINEQNVVSNNLILYPNPAHSVLYFKNKAAFSLAAEVVITNTLGKTVYKNKIADLNSQSINISDLSAGIYFVTFHIDGQRTTKKFVKE